MNISFIANEILKISSFSFGGLDAQIKDITDCIKEIYKIINDKYTPVKRMDIQDYLLMHSGIEPVKVIVSFVVDDYKTLDKEELTNIAAEFGFEFELEQTKFNLIKRNT